MRSWGCSSHSWAQIFHQTFHSPLGHGEHPPVGGGVAGVVVGGHDHRGVGRGLEQGQAGLGEGEGTGQVGLQALGPQVQGLVFQQGDVGQVGGVVQDAVQAPELAVDGFGESLVVRLPGLEEVQGEDGRLGMAGGFDCVVHRFQFLHVAAVKDHGGAVGGKGQGGGAADALAGAGDQDHPALQQVRGSLIVFHHGIGDVAKAAIIGHGGGTGRAGMWYLSAVGNRRGERC
jgi:hypothetical protein